MTFEAFFIPLRTPHQFISLGLGFAGCDGISGKLVLSHGSHYLFKSGGSPTKVKISPSDSWEKSPLEAGMGAAVLVLSPVGCRQGEIVSHSCGLYPGTRAAVWDQPWEGSKSLSVPEIYDLVNIQGQAEVSPAECGGRGNNMGVIIYSFNLNTSPKMSYGVFECV